MGGPTRGVTLEARGLTKRFGGIRALDEVHMTIHPATIVGLIGHNGAGKTTLFDVLTGFLPADGGQVLLDGEDITGWAPHRRAVAEVGRTFQEALLYPSLTVEDAVAVSLEQHLANRDPLAAALRLPASVDSEASAAERVDQLVDLLGLAPYADRPTGELSTGMRRIVELACLLAQDPAVVLFDEPSAGVAQRETEALGPLLRRVQSETGCSMVIIEHDMALLASLCDGFIALEQGAVIAGGTPSQVLSDHRVISSYLGTNEDVVHRWAAAGGRPTARVTSRSGSRGERPRSGGFGRRLAEREPLVVRRLGGVVVVEVGHRGAVARGDQVVEVVLPARAHLGHVGLGVEVVGEAQLGDAVALGEVRLEPPGPAASTDDTARWWGGSQASMVRSMGSAPSSNVRVALMVLPARPRPSSWRTSGRCARAR